MTLSIHLHISKERLELITWGDLVALEESKEAGTANRTVRDIAAKFLTDEEGNYLSTEEAILLLNQLNLTQMHQVVSQLMTEVNNYVGNPTSGSASPSLPQA